MTDRSDPLGLLSSSARYPPQPSNPSTDPDTASRVISSTSMTSAISSTVQPLATVTTPSASSTLIATVTDPTQITLTKAWIGLATATSAPLYATYLGTYSSIAPSTWEVLYSTTEAGPPQTAVFATSATLSLKSDQKPAVSVDPKAAPASSTAGIENSALSGTSLPSTSSGSATLGLPSPISSSVSSGPSTGTAVGATIPGQSSKHGVSAGAAAGIAIGCLAAGILIGALLLFLLRSRSRKRDRQGYQLSSPYEMKEVPSSSPVKSATAVAFAAPEGSSAAIVEDHLPQPVEDKVISGGLSTLKTQINNHVLSYYHIASTQEQTSAKRLEQVLGGSCPVSSERLSAMISSPKTRSSALRFVLSWIIISRLGLGNESGHTFLPAQFQGCVQSLNESDGDERVRGAFLSKWRTITAFLLSTTFGDTAMTENDPRMEQVRKAVADADSILKPYANPREDNAARLMNLEEIVKRAVRFAYTLFSHPSSFHFDWQANADSLAVFPGMLQVTDEAGAALPRPRSFGEKELVRL